jgi:hypothetical protein
MAKGQKRSNREKKKPKKTEAQKSVVAVDTRSDRSVFSSRPSNRPKS